jgi:hypothetical protein
MRTDILCLEESAESENLESENPESEASTNYRKMVSDSGRTEILTERKLSV